MGISPLIDHEPHVTPIRPTLRLVPNTTATDDPAPSEVEILTLVARHVTTTLLPVAAPRAVREQTEQRWHDSLKVIPTVPGHGEWALAYLPGVHCGDNDTYAVHSPSGRVFGGDTDHTAQQPGETTHDWVTRLHEGLHTDLATYAAVYRPIAING